MKNKIWWLVVVFMGIAFAAQATQFRITFETTDCDGSIGFGAVAVDDIYRIDSHECDNNPKLKLKQLLVHGKGGRVGYDVFVVTEAEARKIQAQIRSYMDARQKSIEQGKTIVVE